MPIKKFKKETIFKQQGFSLIEVLIALLILSIGLLATAAMQMMSLQNTSNSEFRSQAVNLTLDMADRMQANYTQVIKDAATTPYDPTNRCAAAGTPDSDACLAARTEYLTWARAISGDLDGNGVPDPGVIPLLPDGNAIVCRDSDHDRVNDLDSDGSGTIDNADDPCSVATNTCDVVGTAGDFSPYVIRVCWTESGGRRDVDGDGDIDAADRDANQIIKNTRVLHQFSITVQ